MCARSLSVIQACWAGVRNAISHKASQKKPSAPVTTKVRRHPYAVASQAITGGDKAPPTAAPVLKIPIPSARSRTGNHSPTTFAAPGQFPASPKPKAARKKPNAAAVRAVAWARAARDHTTIEKMKPLRVPMTS